MAMETYLSMANPWTTLLNMRLYGGDVCVCMCVKELTRKCFCSFQRMYVTVLGRFYGLYFHIFRLTQLPNSFPLHVEQRADDGETEQQYQHATDRHHLDTPVRVDVQLVLIAATGVVGGR